MTPEPAKMSYLYHHEGPSCPIPLDKAQAQLMVQHLREEESSLKQENIRLREEISQLKMVVGPRVPQPNRYAPPAQEQTSSAVYMVLAVLLGLLGIVLGKFVL